MTSGQRRFLATTERVEELYDVPYVSNRRAGSVKGIVPNMVPRFCKMAYHCPLDCSETDCRPKNNLRESQNRTKIVQPTRQCGHF
jgi:hypothetical protein